MLQVENEYEDMVLDSSKKKKETNKKTGRNIYNNFIIYRLTSGEKKEFSNLKE